MKKYNQMKNLALSTFAFLASFLTILCFSSCTNDVLPPPETPEFCDNITVSYNTNVKTIIDESCAYSGCHDGSGGIGPGNYGSYNGVLPVLESSAFRNRVLIQKDDAGLGMPPNASIYAESKKDDLTEEELQIIECWLDAGHPEDL